MLTRKFCVYKAGLKPDAAQEILTVVMMTNDKKVHSSIRLGGVSQLLVWLTILLTRWLRRFFIVYTNVEEI